MEPQLNFMTIVTMIMLSNPQEDLTKIPCGQCHTPTGWRPLLAVTRFNHEKTNFPLLDKHKFADCIQCHTGSTNEELHQFSNAESNCQSCHMDIHFGFLGTSCENCHNSQSWEMSNWRKATDHFAFPLEGMHAQIECTDCHGLGANQISGALTNDCFSCHMKDYNQALATGTHSENSNCILCHNTRGWTPADMSHHDLFFPIFTGKHRGEWSSCEAECHVNSSDYTDFSCGLNGVCHEHRKSKMDDEHDDERGYVYESQSCYQCHPQGEERD